MPRILAVVAVLTVAAGTHAENPKVFPNQTFALFAGETQSTIVPPGLKQQCMQGRILVTHDWRRPPKSVVTGRNLTGGADIASVFDDPFSKPPLKLPGQTPKPENDPKLYPRYDYVTNDHDLVTLNNGNVLYVTGAASREFLVAPWVSETFRGEFGPGARGVLLVFRSTDCGEHFTFLGSLDPAKVEGGSCAWPQFRRDADNNLITQPSTSPKWDMGGQDGQLVKVDPATNRIHVTFSCEGYQPVRGADEFTLDPQARLDKTLVAHSDNEGKDWTTSGFFPNDAWRLGVAPVDANTLAFGYLGSAAFAKWNAATKKYDLDQTLVDKVPPAWGWSGFSFASASNPFIDANMWGHTITARTPGTTDFFTAFPATIPGKGHGYRVRFYNRKDGTFSNDDADAIVPKNPGTKNGIFHLTAIDYGQGPVLLYWLDLEGEARIATVRGRLILGNGQYSNDFVISKSGAAARSFALDPANIGLPYWYGDYWTAGGYRRVAKVIKQGTLPTVTHTYYPLWVEPDQAVHFARVDYVEGINLDMRVVARDSWKKLTLQGIRISDVVVPAEVRKPERRRRKP